MNRDFESWISKFRKSIADYKYYIDFETVYKNVDEIKIGLNILNSLIGSKTIESDFEKILNHYPETIRCIPILLAKRESEIYCSDEDGSFEFHFDELNYSVEEYKSFMK